MPRPSSGVDYFDLMERSLLLDSPHLARVQNDFSTTMVNGAEHFAQTLVKNSFITPYQGKQLLLGKYRGFYLDGKYKLLELLGAGGMGKVFLAEQISMQRLVAIKIVKRSFKNPDQQKEVLARFVREARAVAALQHPNIIHAYDFAEDNGTPYIVMEFVEGVDTAQQVIKFGPLTYRQACDYAVQTARGLGHAHAAGMVHRDVKPQNILVNSQGVIKLLDLGLCVVFEGTSDDSLTVSENQLGTVDYISPEQALDSHNVTPVADIYSLGATLYTLVTGKVLFPGKTTAQKLLLCQTGEPTPVKTLVPNMPDELAEIIHRMLSKNAADRPQSAEEVEKLLAPFAKAVVPPFDLSVLKYTSKTLSGFLGRSPEAEGLQEKLNNQEIAAKSDPTNQDQGKTRTNSSMISMSTTNQADDDFLDQLAELEQVSPPPVPAAKGSKSGTRHKGKKRKKAAQADDSRNVITIVAAVTSLFVALIAIGINIYFNMDPPRRNQNDINQQQASNTGGGNGKKNNQQKKQKNQSNKTEGNNKKETTKQPENKKPPNNKNSSGDGSKPDTPKNNTPKKPPNKPTKPEKTTTPKNDTSNGNTLTAGINAWKEDINKRLEDPELLMALTFQSAKSPAKKKKKFFLKNESNKSPLKDANAAINGSWNSGRWSSKGGLSFQGEKYLQGVAFDDQTVGKIHESPKGFSFGLWIKPELKAKYTQAIVSRDVSHWRLQLNGSDGTLKWSSKKPKTKFYQELSAKKSIADGKWHHVCVTYQIDPAKKANGLVKIYIDGKLDSQNSLRKIVTAEKSFLYMGAPFPYQDAMGYAGQLDEFLLYTRALSDQEISTLHSFGKP